MIFDAVIFDFDGTICDTGEGVKKSVKYALDSFNIPCEPFEQLDFFLGPPLLITFQERYNQTPAQADALVKKFRERYTDTGLYECCLYDGIVDLLRELKSEGFKLGIASSKPKQYVERLLERFGILELFDSVCAVSFQADCETKQSIVSRCVAELGVEPDKAIMVGDRCYDIESANANSLVSVGVNWGYGTRFEFIENSADYIADKISDIKSIALGVYERCEGVKGIFSGKVINVHTDDIILYDGSPAIRECVDHPGGVAVIGLTEDDEVPLVRQFRYPYKETIYEIPAGKLEKGEDPFEAGKREFREETGATAEEYISLGEVYPTPGYTNEIIRLYAARNLTFAEQDLDEDEILFVSKIKFDKLVKMVMSGEIKDAKTIIATLKLKELLNR